MLRHSALIMTSLIARWQSITASFQKLHDSIDKSISSSSQTVDMWGETIRFRLAVDLLHVIYIEYTQILVIQFRIWLSVDRQVFVSKLCRFLRFRAVQYIAKHGSNGTLGDTVCTLNMSRARNARTRGSIHGRCQWFTYCPASPDRLSNPVLETTYLPVNRVRCPFQRG